MTEQPTLPAAEEEPGPNPNTGMGGNNPPEPLPYDAEALAELDADAKGFVEASNQWLKVDVTSETLAGQLADQLDGLRKLFKKIEAARKEAKQPHIDRGKAVDAAFNPIKDLVEKSANNLKPKLQAYAEQKEREAAEERRRREEEARRAEEEAHLKAMDAENSGNIEAQVEADKAKEEAEAKAKEASKPVATGIKSASGAGRTMSTRKRKVCTIQNQRTLFLHYQDRPEVLDVLQRLANAEANAAGFPEDGKIPGVEIEIKNIIA